MTSISPRRPIPHALGPTTLIALLSLAALLAAASRDVCAQSPAEQIRANSDYQAGDATYGSIADADIYDYANVLGVDAYWSMNALGSNSPKVNLIQRRRRRLVGRFYSDAAVTAQSAFLLDGDHPGLSDVATQLQLFSFDAEQGFITTGPRLLTRYSRGVNTITVGADDVDVSYERWMFGPTFVVDAWGFRFWAGPKFIYRVNHFDSATLGKGYVDDTFEFGLHFKLASPDTGGGEPPVFEWTLSRLDLNFESPDVLEDVGIDFRFVHQPGLDEDGRRQVRLFEFEIATRWGSTDARRTVGLRARVWAFRVEFFFNYEQLQVAWATFGTEFRWRNLIVLGRIGIVLPPFSNADVEFNFALQLSLSTGDWISDARLAIFARFELIPYEYDSAVSPSRETARQRLDAGLAIYW